MFFIYPVILFLFNACVPIYNIPEDLEDMTYELLESTKLCVEDISGKELSPRNLTVEKVPADRYHESYGAWCWKRGDKCVFGTTSRLGILVKIAVNPDTMGEARDFVLEHELVHHWLMSNLFKFKHPSPYSECAQYWRKSLVKSEYIDGEHVTYDYIR